MRVPHETNFPSPHTCIMASNHFQVYGVDPYTGPSFNFGNPVSFSSNWRYTVGASKIESWNRTEVHIEVKHMTSLQQAVAQGQTEHSIMFIPHQNLLRIAVADMNPAGYDAPYLQWTEFTLQELFQP